MDRDTVSFYDREADSLANRYEAALMPMIQSLLMRHLPETGPILEIGCGSGRDAAYLAGQVREVTAIDPSLCMLQAAGRLHPELAGALHRASLPLPADSPILARRFAGIYSVAAFMHIPDSELFESVAQVRDLLEPGGIFILSCSTGRDNLYDNRDQNGRLYIERPPEELQLLFERLGFRLVARYDMDDVLGRQIQWHTMVLQNGGGNNTRAVDELETIITRDHKTATYKLALLRALCAIAQTENHIARWRQDGMVSVPLGLVAEKWLLYYWPIVELDIITNQWCVMPQIRGAEKHPIAFRRPLQDLIRFYQPHGGLSAMYADFKSGTIPQPGMPLIDKVINSIAKTIIVGPVTYSGRALAESDQYFQFEGRRSAAGRCQDSRSAISILGNILIPAGAWREMCLIGHWVGESLVLRWAELTHRISSGAVQVKDAIERLLIVPETQRDVQYARSVYDRQPDLVCVWTDRPLKKQFDVDHTLPFSIWHNNDLWNLLPASPAINSKKSDRLVTKALLLSRRDAIIHYWEILKAEADTRFTIELERTLIRNRERQKTDWQKPAFSGLVEHVETLAVQRGIERWEP
jgi:SAM-dependent methyltransferase